MNISFVSLMSEASSDNRGRMIVVRAPDNYPATCVMYLRGCLIRFSIRNYGLLINDY